MEAPAPALAALHDDSLAAVLGRLPVHSLAASRCVCKSWRALVDGRRLLLPHLLPHSVAGLFVNYQDHDRPHFFASPAAPATAAGSIDGKFGFIEHEHTLSLSCYYKVWDHRNGLVLYCDDYGEILMFVCNPATRRWARLPQCPGHAAVLHRAFLVFDPAVSPHYQVLLAPSEPRKKELEDRVMEEWPPSRWTWDEFSSKTRQWEEKVFVRDGDAAGTVGELLLEDDPSYYFSDSRWYYAAYWEGELYVHSSGEFVSRLSLSTGKYRVIKSPLNRTRCNDNERTCLGKSEKGVYFAAVDGRQLRVWILDNGHGDQVEWMLKYDIGLKPDSWWGVVTAGDYHQLLYEGPWILDDYINKGKNNNVEWNSDDEDDAIINTTDEDGEHLHHVVKFLGFHPYKEVIFLTTCDVAVACHLNSSKGQYLGILKPNGWSQGVNDSFVYTPSMIGG